ncbi:hypothetical protein E3P86_01149 [Wallemia ichthyophaga]|uniref:Actin-like protein arp5 n=1 Tax=Wallemia ichthyophaga TaxID=245174 RepID=A0A4T0J913_WALIC|nr:hypothetical protein E3P86_01149 [Wallemia ichthyophaga]
MTNLFELPEQLKVIPDGSDIVNSVKRDVQPGTPIVIDNGTTQLRAGFADQDNPSIIARNEGSRYKERRTNRNMMIYGDALELDSASKTQSKIPHESGIVTSWDMMEHGLDWTFLRLGLETTPPPIVMSEPLCNLPYPRSQMSELLFEAYSTPKVSYGVDSLYSFYNSYHKSDGLIINTSSNTTSVVPVLDGKGIFSACKRVSWGGMQASDLLLRMIQLKYPAFPTKVSSIQASHILENYGTYANDYSDFIKRMEDPDQLKKSDYVIQFPYVAPVFDGKSAEELERQAEKKREAGRRLQEQAAKTRSEKLVNKEAEIKWMEQLRETKAKEPANVYLRKLQEEGFDDEKDLEDLYKRTVKTLQQGRDRELGIEEPTEKETPKFTLVDIPDAQLNEEELKEKKKQRLLKAGYDARMRAKEEKEAEAKKLEDKARMDAYEKEHHFDRWLQKLRDDYNNALARQKEKERMKYALADRKSAAAQNRMRNIADLAHEGKTEAASKGLKRGRKKKEEKEVDDDRFGENDSDWKIYKDIKNENDSEDEEDEAVQLDELEARLLENDVDFTAEHTRLSKLKAQRRLLNTFYYGGEDPYEDDRGDADQTETPEQVKQSHQLHLNIERYRVPEVLFQPSIAGSDKAGLVEMVNHVLKSFSFQEKSRLLGNIHLTGGFAGISNFDNKVYNSLKPIVPVGSAFKVTRTPDPRFDAWRGMAKWARTSDGVEGWVTKEMWDEEGPDRLEARGAYRHALTW